MEEKQTELYNPHLEGYKKCGYCGKYFKLGTMHPCYEYHNKHFTEHGKKRFLKDKTSDK